MEGYLECLNLLTYVRYLHSIWGSDSITLILIFAKNRHSYLTLALEGNCTAKPF